MNQLSAEHLQAQNLNFADFGLSAEHFQVSLLNFADLGLSVEHFQNLQFVEFEIQPLVVYMKIVQLL